MPTRGLHERTRQLRVRCIRPAVLHQLERHHRPERPHLTDAGKAHSQALEARGHETTDVLRACEQLFLAHHLQHREPGGAGEWRAREGATESARPRRVHDVRLAGDRRQRHPAGDALGDGDQIGLDAAVLDGEHAPGAPEARLDLIGDQHDAVGVAHAAQASQQLGRCRVETAFAEHRLDDDGGDARRIDVRLEQLLE